MSAVFNDSIPCTTAPVFSAKQIIKLKYLCSIAVELNIASHLHNLRAVQSEYNRRSRASKQTTERTELNVRFYRSPKLDRDEST